MLSEIEHLQSVLADIIKQTISPSTLPLAGEDLVRDFRLSDHHNYEDQVMSGKKKKKKTPIGVEGILEKKKQKKKQRSLGM